MKKILLPIFLLILFSCSSKKYSDLNGNVESLQEKDYEASEKFGEPIKGDLKNVNSYTFNEKGNILKFVIYDSDGDKYLETEYQYKNGKEFLLTSTKKKFDYSINRYKDIEEKQELVSDEKSQSIWSVSSIDKGETNVDTIIIKFDDKHNPQTRTTKKHDGTQEINYYAYDKNGRMTESKWLMNGKDIQQWEKYEYKENLIVKKNILYMYGTKKDDSIIFKYKTDNHSNWIERITYENGEATGITERIIKYW